MTTTAIIVEILVIGYTSFIWLLPFVMYVLGISSRDMLCRAVEHKDWAALIALILTTLAYQIGWLLDYYTYLFFYYVPLWPRRLLYGRESPGPGGKRFLPLGRTIKRRYISDGEYWEVYTLVHEKASVAVIASLRTDLSLIRFSRSGVVNFSGIAAVSLWVLQSWPLALLCSAIALTSLYLLGWRWDMYYRKIKICWKHLMGPQTGPRGPER